MSQIAITGTRTTGVLTSQQLLSDLRRTQLELLREQEKASSGYESPRPSDAAGLAGLIQTLQARIEASTQQERNLDHASGVLNATDQALSEGSDVLLEAKSLALSQLGLDVTAETRREQVVVVDSLVTSLVDLANREFAGVPLFGGTHSQDVDQLVFTDFLGGIRYTGAEVGLSGDVGLNDPLAFNATGVDAFGALSARVKSQIDLDPATTAQVRLSSLNGAQGQGIRTGSVEIAVDGTPVTVDLTTADSLGDVVTRINDAIGAVDPTAGLLSVSATGLSLTANPAHTIVIDDLGSGHTAADLGIVVTATATTVAGADLDPRLAPLTDLATLGATIDFTGGLKITQGGVTKVADFSAAATVQDLITEVDRLELGVRLRINPEGTGLELISEVSGLELSVGENAGGTTAGDLGIRTFEGDTQLDDFNRGLGINTLQGQDDIEVSVHSGVSFPVNLDGASTVTDVIGLIASAATTAGLSVGVPGDAGTDINIGLATDGNGFLFEDGTAGAGSFRIGALNSSLAGTDLGIVTDVGSGSAIQGEDRAKVRVESVFTHLIDLRAAFTKNDTSGITFAGERLEESIESLAQAHAEIGTRARRVEDQSQRLSDQKTQEQVVLSQIRDADITEVVTRLTQLQQQLQISLQVGASRLQLSLLDFLR